MTQTLQLRRNNATGWGTTVLAAGEIGVLQNEAKTAVLGVKVGNGSTGFASLPLLERIDISGLAPLASPAFTGVPTAPTATSGTNTTQLATTAFVTQSPAFAGTPTAPTPPAGDNSTRLATTAFVTSSIEDAITEGIDLTPYQKVDQKDAAATAFTTPVANHYPTTGAVKDYLEQRLEGAVSTFRGVQGTKAALTALSTTGLLKNDTAIVDADESQNGQRTKYIWNGSAWTFAYAVNETADNSTIELNGTAKYQLKAGGITNNHVSATAAIALTKLGNATLTDAAAASTLPATSASAITALLQTVRNCLKYLVAAVIPAGTNGYVATHSGTAGTFGTPIGFDAAPTSGSNNLVKSGGIYTVLNNKQATLTAGFGIAITDNTISWANTVDLN